MRRRIAMLDEMVDTTTRVWHNVHETDQPGVFEQESLDAQDAVLYDDALWERLRAAQKQVRDLETEILAKVVSEPLDDVEMECAIAMHATNRDWATWHDLEDRLREHARNRG